jgi:hypothetical protein
MGHDNQWHSVFSILGRMLNNRINGNSLYTQNSGQIGQNPRLIRHMEPQEAWAITTRNNGGWIRQCSNQS